MIRAQRAIVVAFDGLITDTLDQRTFAVVEGIAAVGFTIDTPIVRSLIAGLTLAEAVRLSFDVSGFDIDETTIDIAIMRATRLLSTTMRQAVLLAPSAAEWMQRAAMHSRLIVRADSERSFVDTVLGTSGISDYIAFVVCPDDIPHSRTGVPTFISSWNVIANRCEALGVNRENLHGLECASEELCTRVHAARIHRVTRVTEVAPDALQLS